MSPSIEKISDRILSLKAFEKKKTEQDISDLEDLQKLQKKNSKMIPNSISTEQFKEIFWKEGKKYFQSKNRHFIVDDQNRRFLDLICRYLTNDNLFEKKYNGELKKGLLIYGPCGTGKSSVIDIIRNISRTYKFKQLWFSNISVHDVISQYNLEGEHIVEKYRKGRVHFDDLGSEKLANSWGVKEKLMARIIELRYNEFKHKGTKTFTTTNLTIEELALFYGNNADANRNRFADRIYEMFNIIPLDGTSRRF